ncbi:iron-containing redox enzyme family protein [Pseudomonas sp. BN102]|uniref:iron-containing redox enzyme family protein n=1 Tax=Pseudomonas sp. BN102 TaxID=2567886 RepID=UPI002457040D|nr:iron-containing redox enzyme family protein [Pseudomonas sp. BN102]MDH4609315.1 iron-containing redox enzyme family protein [Pseudomonas sp. BN102]
MNEKVVNLKAWLKSAWDSKEQWSSANDNPAQREQLCLAARVLATRAYSEQDDHALTQLHQCLALIYRHEFECIQFEQIDMDTRPALGEILSILENSMLQHEIREIGPTSTLDYPEQGTQYVKWLKKLISQCPSSVHEFYTEFLSERATAEDLKYYLIQETNLDPRFDDILAFMQVGLPVDQKMELAKNYFDEMGNGQSAEVHSRIFSETLEAVGITPHDLSHNMLTNSIASGNLSACLALSRRHFYKAVGYFGVTEYLAPRRFKHVVKAWKRNNLPVEGAKYHNLHIYIDTEHANGWFNNVVAPLVEQDPRIGEEIAKGALMRINSSARYLDELMQKLSTPTPLAV